MLAGLERRRRAPAPFVVAAGLACVLVAVFALGSSVHADAGTRARDAGARAASDAGATAAAIDGGGALDASIDGGALDASIDGAVLDGGATPLDAASDADGGVEPLLTLPELPSIPEIPEIPPEVAATSQDVVRTLLGLVALITLAWLGGHERVRALERRVGIEQVLTTGLPFVVLGLIAHTPSVGILSDEVLRRITPLLQFGLGWIGFHTGFQLDARTTNEVPRGTGTVVILLTTFPLLLIAAASGLALWALGSSEDPLNLVRDSMMLGLAGALSAPFGGRLVTAAQELLRTVGVLDDVVAIIASVCLAAFLHPPPATTGWELPGVGWIFVTFGMASVLGLVTFTVLRGPESTAEKAALLLGSVCFTAGMAGVFTLPPLAVAFLAGVLLRNLPGLDTRQLEEAFERLERPIYHLFLLIVGALWRPSAVEGWLLVPVFLGARMLGRWGGARAARGLPADSRPDALVKTSDLDLVAPPMGPLSIAFVVSALTLYESPSIRAMVTTVIVGSILNEVFVQATAARRSARRTTADEVAS